MNEDRVKNKSTQKSQDEQVQKLFELVESTLNLKHWGFQKTFVDDSVTLSLGIIYDSEWCRVKFVSSGIDTNRGDDNISIYYGRLHAANESTIMHWNGKLCYCWHRINEALNFLDGLTPEDAVNQLRLHRKWSNVMEEFRQSDLGQELKYRQPEWLIRMHASIWNFYGERLFELFDLRQPDLWQRYSSFYSEFHKIKGTKPLTGYPPDENIC